VTRFIEEQRARLYGYLDAAMSAVLVGLRANDHEFAYQLLKDLGVVPSEADRLAAQRPETTGSTSDGVKRQLEKIAMVMMERHEIYNTPFDEVEHAIGEKLLPLGHTAERTAKKSR